ncbi:MAG: hypothetical protein OSJ74_05000 [Clostridia bacterium]|nr:hypothetical protein [Clostridia bacterium]
MHQDLWSKSLLATYNALPLVVKCIDRSNMQMALGSFSYQGNALDLMNKLMANNARKELLINAKVIVDNALDALKPNSRRVLELRYLQRKSFEEIADALNICLRSVFRWHEIALKQFSSYCIIKGYDEKWLDKRYAEDPVFVKGIRYCQLKDKSQAVEDKKVKIADRLNLRGGYMSFSAEGASRVASM